MKAFIIPFFFISCSSFSQSVADSLPSRNGNLIIITIDGFRWQELFSGADEQLISNPNATPDTATMKAMYWSNDQNERRKKLMPFVWNVIASKGQLYGNRHYDNKMNVSNLYAVSYPGYHELFTGKAALNVRSNKRKTSQYPNILEELNSREAYHGKVAAFSSWDVLPYILNEERSGIPVNSGYEKMTDAGNSHETVMSESLSEQHFFQKQHTRLDQLTFVAAKEYMRTQKPKVVYIGWGEADEFAHAGRYDLYLEQANKVDRMMAELWHFIQTTEGYKDNT
ncbi:MAG: phosphoglyceromutase, partial [Pedobacter sp.]